MRRRLVVLTGLTLLALTLTAIEAVRPPAGPEVDQFQRLTGGLGMGATAALYWDFSTFDPRLEPDCACSLWPVPGGYLFSPEHRLTVWDPPELLGPIISPPLRSPEEPR